MSGDAVSVARDASAIIPGKECRRLMDDVLLFCYPTSMSPVHCFRPACGLGKLGVVWG
jgi:hypothetical protein